MQYTFRDYHLFQLLRRFESQHLPLNLFLNQYFKANKALGSKDRKMIGETVYGMTRWRLLLDYLIGTNPSWEKRFALYQRFQPTQYATVNSIPPHIRVSCPEPFYRALVADYGEQQASYLAQINNTPAPIMVRVNPLKVSRDALIFRWLQQGYDVAAASRSSLGIEFKQRVPLTAMAEHREGWFEIQDEGSQLVANLVQVQPGQQVLDYCAGAGGKSLAFAPSMADSGQLYLHDIRPIALAQAKKRFRRAGFQSVQFLEAGHPQLSKLHEKMDWVLLDVPCSGTGTFRRNPDQKWKFSLEQVKQLVSVQREIVAQALSYLKPGGKLVYATCSILKAENEEQVAHFLKTLPLHPAGEPFWSHPSFGGMDGFYAFTFQKATTRLK